MHSPLTVLKNEFTTMGKMNKTVENLIDGLFITGGINVVNHGIIPNAPYAQSAEIQALINKYPGVKLFFPIGTYKTNSTIDIGITNTFIKGAGQGTIFEPISDYGPVFRAANPAGLIVGLGLSDFAIRPPNSIWPLSNIIGIELDGVQVFYIHNIVPRNCFIGLSLAGCGQGNIDNVIMNWANNAGQITNRRFLVLKETNNTNITNKHCGDVFISNFNVRGGNSNVVDYGIEINAVDGIFFNNFHIAWASVANLLIDAKTVVKCNGISFRNGWFDLRGSGVIIKGNTPVTPGNYVFTNNIFLGGNIGANGIEIDGSANNVRITNNYFVGYYKDGILIKSTYTGSGGQIANNTIENCSQQGAGLFNGINYASNTKWNISDNEISGTLHNRHIYIDGLKTEATIKDNIFSGNAVTEKMNTLTGTEICQEQNKGFNPVGNISQAIGASPYTYTNNFGFPLEILISGGTVSQISKNATVLTGVTAGQFIIAPKETITITYTVAPNFFLFGL